MSFDHKLVSKLLAAHEHGVQFYTNNIRTTDPEREAARARYLREVEGLPVARQLADLCDEVRKVARGVRFAIDRNPKAQWQNGLQVTSEIWAYFPGDEYATMRLGYADYSVSTGDTRYAIYSRNIRNQKFNEGREQYYMVMSDKLPRIVAAVKSNLRRYTVQEVASMRIEDFGMKVRSPAWTASSECADAKRNVIDSDSFFPELRAMVERGYEFNDPAFGTAVRAYVAKMEEAVAKNNEQHHGYYVQVRDHMGEQVFDVIVILDVKKATSKHVQPHKTLSADELATLDEELPSRLATLSMLDKGAFVEGLGLKASDTAYWVLK